MIAHEHTQHFLLLQRRLHFPQSKDGSTTWEPFYSEAGPFAEKNNHCFTGVGITELYRALRLDVNCFQPSMKLLSKQREEKTVRYVYDPARTPLQRLLLSGILPAQKQQELFAVAQALDPIRLFQQRELLQQAVFRRAVGYSPCISSLPSAPIHVFSVEQCMTAKLPAQGSIPDRATGLQTLYREQERRKRVVGWRRTHKDPFEGEWEQIISRLVANPERA